VAKGADCKSAGLRLRRFESYLSHQSLTPASRATARQAGATLSVIYDLIKFLHIIGAIGATVILGTGAGIAFFMLVAHLSRDPAFIARTAAVVVLADFLFTATAITTQPVTGYLLMQATGIP
jgi:hypothetical protein